MPEEVIFKKVVLRVNVNRDDLNEDQLDDVVRWAQKLIRRGMEMTKTMIESKGTAELGIIGSVTLDFSEEISVPPAV